MNPTFCPTQDKKADELLSKNPLALLLGMLLDQQIPIERAFYGPFELKNRLGHLDAKKIANMNSHSLIDIFQLKPALHRYPKDMATRFYQLCNIIVKDYNNNPKSIWEESNTAEELLSKLKNLPGYSDHKAKIFIAILGKHFDLKLKDWRKVSAPFGKTNTFLSAADVGSKEDLIRVRENKRLLKSR
jgi:uncharacterized HhH-GPD family protein